MEIYIPEWVLYTFYGSFGCLALEITSVIFIALVSRGQEKGKSKKVEEIQEKIKTWVDK